MSGHRLLRVVAERKAHHWRVNVECACGDVVSECTKSNDLQAEARLYKTLWVSHLGRAPAPVDEPDEPAPTTTGPSPLLVRFLDGETLMHQIVYRCAAFIPLSEEAALGPGGQVALLQRPDGNVAYLTTGELVVLDFDESGCWIRYRLSLSGDRERNVATYRVVTE